jgi:endonuclease III-like uncharacterized protein
MKQKNNNVLGLGVIFIQRTNSHCMKHELENCSTIDVTKQRQIKDLEKPPLPK